MTLTIGSLFAGIGGLELGLERGIGNGAHTVWQVEQNAYCRAVLAKHWPDAIRYEDVRDVGRSNLAPVDVICGGFPCQDISLAGAGEGLAGARSGLWYEYARIVRELRPRYVVVENVAALLVRGIDRVLGSLAELGYDAEWSVVSACAVGATHMRERLFIVAHAERHGVQGWTPQSSTGRQESRKEQLPRLLFPRVEAAVSAARVWRDQHGVRGRLDVARNMAVGNAVVPQVAEVVGRLIAQREADQCAA